MTIVDAMKYSRSRGTTKQQPFEESYFLDDPRQQPYLTMWLKVTRINNAKFYNSEVEEIWHWPWITFRLFRVQHDGLKIIMEV